MMADTAAVSVASAKSLPVGRMLEPEVKEVACDHLSYFTSEQGLRALGQSLQ